MGQLLTANASAVADVDGLPAPATFAWQWLRVDGGSETDDSAAPRWSTYRLVEADAGKKFKVQVTFTDLDGSEESRTSAPYPATDTQVLANTAPTGADKTVTVAEDESYTFAGFGLRVRADSGHG